MLLSTVGGVALLGGANACGVASAASAGGAWVEVSPGTVAAGQQVAIRADCSDTSNTASVTSKAFGTVTLKFTNATFIADITVPATTRAGTFDVTLNCRSSATATTTITIHSDRHVPGTVGPHTGGGYLASGGIDEGTAWLVGGGAAMVAAGAVGLVSRRRRRRATTH